MSLCKYGWNCTIICTHMCIWLKFVHNHIHLYVNMAEICIQSYASIWKYGWKSGYNHMHPYENMAEKVDTIICILLYIEIYIISKYTVNFNGLVGLWFDGITWCKNYHLFCDYRSWGSDCSHEAIRKATFFSFNSSFFYERLQVLVVVALSKIVL